MTGIISSYVGLLGGSNNLGETQKSLRAAMARVSSSAQIIRASDDAAGLAIGSGLRGDTSLLRTAFSNGTQASSVLQIADAGIRQASEGVERLRELATKANSGSLSAKQRESLDAEFQGVLKQIGDIAKNTSFNSKALLSGQGSVSFQIGLEGTDITEVVLPNLLAGNLFVDNKGQPADLSIKTQQDAVAALDVIDTAANTLNKFLSDIGGTQSTLSSVSDQIQIALQNSEAAASVLLDADFASSTTDLLNLRYKFDVQAALQAQTGRLPDNLLKLLGT